MSGPTTRPWSQDRYGTVKDQNGQAIAANGIASVMCSGEWQDEAKANAELIVRAVNAHDELVEALTTAHVFIKTITGDRGTGLVAMLEATLARAKGATP